MIWWFVSDPMHNDVAVAECGDEIPLHCSPAATSNNYVLWHSIGSMGLQPCMKIQVTILLAISLCFFVSVIINILLISQKNNVERSMKRTM